MFGTAGRILAPTDCAARIAGTRSVGNQQALELQRAHRAKLCPDRVGLADPHFDGSGDDGPVELEAAKFLSRG